MTISLDSLPYTYLCHTQPSQYINIKAIISVFLGRIPIHRHEDHQSTKILSLYQTVDITDIVFVVKKMMDPVISRKRKAEELIREGEEIILDEDDENREQSSERPEDLIPDLPENQAVREFLKTAPRNGLHLPLGKEVKVMQCWRCKAFGHRSGDKECPLRISGNLNAENARIRREDPMNSYVPNFDPELEEKYRRVELMKILLEEVREEERERKRLKKEKKDRKREKKLLKEKDAK